MLREARGDFPAATRPQPSDYPVSTGSFAFSQPAMPSGIAYTSA